MLFRSRRMMSSKNGGPAFPVKRQYFEYGMTLRDYFAAKAVAGMFYPAIADSLMGDHDLDCDQLATYAYTMADAMLKAREENAD